MVLYIDETENADYFIVAGLLANSENDVENAYRGFKKSIKGLKVSEKAKSKIYTEFKSTLIDRNYYRVKEKLLESVSALDAEVVFSCYRKRTDKLNQIQKEAVYITLISNILAALPETTDVIFDRFGIADFENNIVLAADNYASVSSIMPADSQIVHGLQFADNLCSTIRYHVSDEDHRDYFRWIKSMTKEV